MQKLFLLSISLLFTVYLSAQGDSASNNNIIKINSSASVKKDSVSSVTVPELSIYPNPAKNKVTLQVKGFEPGSAKVKIIDTRGKTIREDSRLLTNGSEDIVMFLMLQPGIYFIILTEKGKIARRKLVIQ